MDKSLKKACKKWLALVLSMAMLITSFTPVAAYADVGEERGNLPNLLELPKTDDNWGEIVTGLVVNNSYKYSKVSGNTVELPEYKGFPWLLGHTIDIGKFNGSGIQPDIIRSGIKAEIFFDGQPVTGDMSTDKWTVKLGTRKNSIGLAPKGYDAKGTVTFKFEGYAPIDITVKGPKDPNKPVLKNYWDLKKGDEDYGELCQQAWNQKENNLDWIKVQNKEVKLDKKDKAQQIKIGKYDNELTTPYDITSKKQAKIFFNDVDTKNEINNEDWFVNGNYTANQHNILTVKAKKYGLKAKVRYEFPGYEPFEVTVKGPEDPNSKPGELKDFFTLPESDSDYAKICYNLDDLNWQKTDVPEVQLKKTGVQQEIKIGRYNGNGQMPYNLKSDKAAKISFNGQVIYDRNSNPVNNENWEVNADERFQDNNHVRIVAKKNGIEGKLKFEFKGIKPFEVTVKAPKDSTDPQPIPQEKMGVVYQNAKNEKQWMPAEKDEKTGLYRVIVKPGAQRKVSIGTLSDSSKVEFTKKDVRFTDEKGGKLPVSAGDDNSTWRFPQAGNNWTTVSSGTTSDRKVIVAKIAGQEDIKIELISSEFPENVATKASKDGILFSHKEFKKDGTPYWRTLYGNAMKAEYDWKDSHTFKAVLSDGTFADITAKDSDVNKGITFGGDSKKEATVKFNTAKEYILHAENGKNVKDIKVVIEKPIEAYAKYSFDGAKWFDLNDQKQAEVVLGKSILFMLDDGTASKWVFSGEGNYEDIVTIEPRDEAMVLVTPKKEGNVKIKAQNRNSRKIVYFNLKVKRIKATDITLDVPSTDVFVGDLVKIGHKVAPADTTDKLVWSVETPGMGKIDADGNFMPLNPGKVTIKAQAGDVVKFITLTVKDKELVKIYFKPNNSDKKVYVDENDVIDLMITDSGNFYAEGENIEVVDWCAKEKYYLNDKEYAFHFWIDGGQGAEGTRFFPRKVAEQPAKLIYKKNGKTFTKEFTLNVLPSDIEEIKAYENGKEISSTEVMEVQGRERRHITVKGRKKGTNTFVDIPDTAYDIIPKYNQHIIGSSFALWEPGIHTITVKMKDNDSAKFEFKANSNYVPVTGLKGEVPKKWYIDSWASPFNQYTGIRWYDDINDGYTLMVDPEIASNITLNWEALTPDIAIYDPTNSNGIVPKKAGLAKFKVTSDDNPKVSTEVEVEFLYKAPLTSVKAKDNYQVDVGEIKDFDLTISPEDATEQRFQWTYEGNGEVEIQDVIHTDPTNVNIPKWTTHKMIGKKSGIVKVTGIPYDNTNNVKPVQFTVKIGDGKSDENINTDIKLLEGNHRFFGADRYETAVKAADVLKKEMGVNKFNNIIIATGSDYPDALSGSYLAKAKKAPVLLADNRQPKATTDYVKANLESNGTVYLLGGEAVISDSIRTDLEKQGYKVVRLGGRDRYETNLNILKASGAKGEDLLVCTGMDFADCLSASAAEKPILLVSKTLNAEQKAYLAGADFRNVYLIGGEGVVNSNYMTAMKPYSTTDVIERVSGADRYATSVAVAEKFFKKPENLVFAYASDFPDGISGGPVAMAFNAPMLLVDDNNSTDAMKYADKLNIKRTITLGGPTLISKDTVERIVR